MSVVFKFGGSSLKSSERVKNCANIIIENLSRDQKIFIVVSAPGKTTALLKEIFERSNKEEAESLFIDLKSYLASLYTSLDLVEYNQSFLSEFFKQLDECYYLEERDNAHLDKFLSFGEIFSSNLLNLYLNKIGLDSTFLDSRKFIKTDSNFLNASVDFKETSELISKLEFRPESVLVAPGFIASDPFGNTTTLGFEGSDYSAAIFGRYLKSKIVCIYTDVTGIKTCDPRFSNNFKHVSNLSYDEAITLTSLGSKVLFPNTMRPLKESKIELFVLSSLSPISNKTTISNISTKEIITSRMFLTEEISFNEIHIDDLMKLTSKKATSFILESVVGLGLESVHLGGKPLKVLGLPAFSRSHTFKVN